MLKVGITGGIGSGKSVVCRVFETLGIPVFSADDAAKHVMQHDAALVAAVSADHRGAAFETCARLVDAVKERLPVWKHQFFVDGTDEWVNSA